MHLCSSQFCISNFPQYSFINYFTDIKWNSRRTNIRRKNPYYFIYVISVCQVGMKALDSFFIHYSFHSCCVYSILRNLIFSVEFLLCVFIIDKFLLCMWEQVNNSFFIFVSHLLPLFQNFLHWSMCTGVLFLFLNIIIFSHLCS